jgi:DNA-binding MarR family transcriptional regulator
MTLRQPTPDQVARSLQLSIRLLNHRLRLVPVDTELALPEASALARLERLGASDVTTLARAEGISAQSIGATLATLESRGYVARRLDPEDGRRRVLLVTEAGAAALAARRHQRADQLARALGEDFTADELARLLDAAPLIERLAERL